MSRKNVLLLIAAGLAILFERFGYYSVRGVLMLMMLRQMQLPEAEASVIYADFTNQVFLMAIVGALAVLVLGARITTIVGGVIAAVGIGLLVPADPSLLTTALFLVALGSGLFKMGVYAAAGSALMESSGATAAGVMLFFYAALNLGAFFAPLVTGTVAGIVFLAIGRVRRGLRLEWIFAAGMLVFAASALVVLAPGGGLPATARVVVSVVLGAAGEVILSGAVLARLAAGTSPRLAGLSLAPYFLVAYVSNRVSRTLNELPDTIGWTWGFAGAVALLGIVAVALSGVFERRVYAASKPALAAAEAPAA